MKNAMVLTLADLLTAPSLGFVAAPNTVMVFARQDDKGSVSIGDRYFRTQTFKVRLMNAAKSEISLKNSCLVAQSVTGQSFRLDTADGELITGTLKPGATAEGDAIFVSEDDAVYGASLIRLSDRCKQATSRCATKTAGQPRRLSGVRGRPSKASAQI